MPKKHILAGVLMVTSGILSLFAIPLSANGLNALLQISFIGYVIFIPPLLLIVAGLLSFGCKPTTNPQDKQPNSNMH